MRSAIVLAVAVVGMVAAALYGVMLLREDPEPSAGSVDETEGAAATWNTFRVTDQGLVIEKITNPCTSISDVEVEETDERVVVTVFVETEGAVCTDVAVTRRARLELDEPLGSRRVFDGSCLARDVPVRTCLRDG